MQQPERNYRCQLIEKVALFIEVGKRLCPLIKPHYPRRTRYSPLLRYDFRRMCLRQLFDLFRSDRAPNLEIHKVFPAVFWLVGSKNSLTSSTFANPSKIRSVLVITDVGKIQIERLKN